MTLFRIFFLGATLFSSLQMHAEMPSVFFEETFASFLPSEEMDGVLGKSLKKMSVAINDLYDSHAIADGRAVLRLFDSVSAQVALQDGILKEDATTFLDALKVSMLKHLSLHLISIAEHKLVSALEKMLRLHKVVLLELHEKNSVRGRIARKLRQVLHVRTLTHDDMLHHKRDIESVIEELSKELGAIDIKRNFVTLAQGRLITLNRAYFATRSIEGLCSQVARNDMTAITREHIETVYESLERDILLCMKKVSYIAPSVISSYIIPLSMSVATVAACSIAYKNCSDGQRALVDGHVQNAGSVLGRFKDGFLQWCRDARSGIARLCGFESGQSVALAQRVGAVHGAIGEEVGSLSEYRFNDQKLLFERVPPHAHGEIHDALVRVCDDIAAMPMPHDGDIGQQRDLFIAGARHCVEEIRTNNRGYVPGDGLACVERFEQDLQVMEDCLDHASDARLISDFARLRHFYKQYVYTKLDNVEAPSILEDLPRDAHTLVDAITGQFVGVTDVAAALWRRNTGIGDVVKLRAQRWTDVVAIAARMSGILLGPIMRSAGRVASFAKDQALDAC
jgi:hypothetical protein